MKNFSRAIVAVVLACALVLAGCTGDLKERVDEIDKRVTSLESLTKALNEKMADNLLVKTITPVGTNGWDIVFSNDTKVEVRNGEKGADGITPMIKVEANGADGFSLWYNITKDYPESGWVNTGVDIQGPAGPSGSGTGNDKFDMRESGGQIQYTVDGETWTNVVAMPSGGASLSVSKNADGTVTFITAEGSFVFAVVKTAVTRIDVLDAIVAPIGSGDNAVDAILFRVSPSDADVTTYAASQWLLDDASPYGLLTRADIGYVSTSEHFVVESVAEEVDGVKGQYIAKVKGMGSVHGTYNLMLVLNVGTDAEPVLISSGAFPLELGEGALVPDSDLETFIAEDIHDDGYAVAPYTFGFDANDTWTISVEGVDASTRADATWVTIEENSGTANDGAGEVDDDIAVEITLDENKGDTAQAREAVVTIATDDGTATITFTIYQDVASDVFDEAGFSDGVKDALEDLFGPGGDDILDDEGRLSAAAASNVTYLEFTGVDLTADDIAKIDEYFPILETLVIETNDTLDDIDLSSFDKLVNLSIIGTDIESITLPAPKEGEESNLLEMLEIKGCENLTSIDLSECTALEMVVMNDNGLTSITMPTEANDLLDLDLKNNKLTSLDVSMCPNLSELDVDGNPGSLVVIGGPSTRAGDDVYVFSVKVWRDFFEDVPLDFSADETFWTYELNGKNVTVTLKYEPVAANYATSVVISSEDATLSGSAGARTLSVKSNVESIDLVGTVNANADADMKDVSWKSSNEAIASVGEYTGLVEFTGEVGKVVITATADGSDPDKAAVTDVLTITVNPAVSVTGLAIAAFSDEVGGEAMNVAAIVASGEEIPVYLGATITPTEPTFDDVVWSIVEGTGNSGDVFDIDTNTGVVTISEEAEAGDTAVAKATIVNGVAFGHDKTATITLTMIAAPEEPVITEPGEEEGEEEGAGTEE